MSESKKTFEEFMSDIFKRHLQEFFAKSAFERLEAAKSHFEKVEVGKRINGKFIPFAEIQFNALKMVIEKATEYVREECYRPGYDSADEDYLKSHDDQLQDYIEHKWKEAFFLLTPLFLAEFYLFNDKGAPKFDPKLKESLRQASGLDTATKRKAACFEYLEQLFLDETVKKGGDRRNFWNEKTRRKFLADYNRFYFVVENKRSDKEQLKKIRLSHKKIQDRIQKTYEIPDECIEDVFLEDPIGTIAMEWAKHESQNHTSDKNLRDRILPQARKEEKRRLGRKQSRQLVGFSIRNNGMNDVYYVDLNEPNHGKALRYTLPNREEED